MRSLLGTTALLATMLAGAMGVRAETLPEALAYAYANNPNIASARLSVESSGEDIAIAKSDALPNISLGANYTASFSATDDLFSTSQNFTLGLNYSQTIFDNHRTDGQVEQSRAFSELATHALANAEQNVLLSAVDAYMSVVRDTQLVAIRQENIAFFRAQVGSANDRLRLGEGTRTDVSQAEARLAQAVAAHQAAIASLQTSQASYQRWVGRPPQNLSASFTYQGLLPQSIDEAIETAQADHPALKSARAAIRASQAGADIARSAFGPTLQLIGSVCAVGCFGADGPGGMSGQIGLTLSIPIYEGGSLGAGQRKANLELIKSEVDALSSYDEVREAIVTAWATVINSEAQISSAQSAVASGQEFVSGLVEERDLGLRTTLDVLDAQSDLVTSREALVQANASRVIAQYTLLASVGRLSATNLGLPVTVEDGQAYVQVVEDVWQELRAVPAP
ncbi:hypothetical protein EMQ25_02505 [Arsenicitalea aurantiaca]|uniref:Transporter n=1 Tax=Arsenicitalea aurantiaca TaxID=1783274 RepID=A0A433XL91_9HYPH|nr:TolC family outer membrane protein [Arsenicitalea aurantiaca]RUT34849.1 hypothetical protein EMQ25_02505 [Arsenicitalea aurantiaca]